MGKYYFSKRGFTLIELLVVLAIIAILLVVVISTVASGKSRGRDSQVRSDIQLLKLSFVRYRESGVNSTYAYPSTGGIWQCLKSSGTCWNGSYSGNATTLSTISGYFSGSIVPRPTGSKTGEYRHDAYLYANPIVPTAGQPSGAYIVWPQEKIIANADCNGWNAGLLSDGLYYCYERLPY